MEKKKQENTRIFKLLRRFRTPLLVFAALSVTGLFIIPALINSSSAGSFLAGMSLNIGAPDIIASPPIQTAIPIGTPSPSAEPQPAASPENVYKLLQTGDEDPQVALIQTRLMELHFMDSDEPSESFGNTTEAAILRFQNSHHMTETGVADELTQSMLFSDSAKQYVLAQGNHGNDVLLMQKQLNELGYYEEKQNGYFGVATERALKAFQAKNQLSQNGIADRTTRDILFSPLAKSESGSVLTQEPDPTPKKTAKATPTPRVTAKATPTPKVTAKATPAPKVTAKATPTPKVTAKVTPTPTPKATPTPKITAPPTISNGDVNDFISVAEDQLGKPYIYSDEGPNSFDCSGLVYYCLKQVGVSVKRYSASGFSQVERWTTVLGMDNLKRGDLIFFYDPGTTRIGHVGIWYGNNKYLHASSSAGKVIISTCGSWANTNFAWGKRVF